jgi:hypothetical protein
MTAPTSKDPITRLLEWYSAWWDRHFTSIEGCAVVSIIYVLLALMAAIDPRGGIGMVYCFWVFFGVSSLFLGLAISQMRKGASS